MSPARAERTARTLRRQGIRAAFERSFPYVLFGALPAVVAVTMFAIALRSGPLALDFHHELYPEAKEIIAGNNPFPAAGTDLTRGENYVWPPLAALLVSPLTVLPPTVADVAIGLLGLACIGAALWLVGVRDWRVYGATALWPQVIGEIRISHLTPVLCLLAAIVWRYRDSTVRPGLALGLAGAVKFFLWPLGLWLLALRNARAALLAAAAAAASLLLVLPFTGLGDFARLMVDLGRAFDQDSYSPFGLLVRLGASDALARGVTLAFGAVLLVVMWRRRSFALAIAASLALAPIVWWTITRSPPFRSRWRDHGCRPSGSCRWQPGDCRAPESRQVPSGGSGEYSSCSQSSLQELTAADLNDASGLAYGLSPSSTGQPGRPL